jgi:hypothetical protein
MSASVHTERLRRVADYSVHESFQAETVDHEDHTFCGIMFDVTVKATLPLDYIEISHVWVRGALGDLTVWFTEDGHAGKLSRRELWTQVFSGERRPSPSALCPLELSSKIRVKPGERVGLYVHSTRPGDEAIVYDNQRHEASFEDRFLQVLPGVAHISNRAFDPRGMWGYAWRPNREFVGRLSLGVRYLLWRPERAVHQRFPRAYRRAALALIKIAARPGTGLNRCPCDIPFLVMQFCRWDWFGALGEDEDTLVRTAQDLAAEDVGRHGIDWRSQGTDYRQLLVQHHRRNFGDGEAAEEEEEDDDDDDDDMQNSEDNDDDDDDDDDDDEDYVDAGNAADDEGADAPATPTPAVSTGAEEGAVTAVLATTAKGK